jgi:hypothetical protein
MTDSTPLPGESDMPRRPTWRGDRPYTIRLTMACLVIGLVIAIPAGALLYSLNRPLTLQNGDVAWTFGTVAFPLALLVSGVVLAGSVFTLPLIIARRSGRVLDPTLWPALGVYVLTGLLVVTFVVGIIAGVI